MFFSHHKKYTPPTTKMPVADRRKNFPPAGCRLLLKANVQPRQKLEDTQGATDRRWILEAKAAGGSRNGPCFDGWFSNVCETPIKHHIETQALEAVHLTRAAMRKMVVVWWKPSQHPKCEWCWLNNRELGRCREHDQQINGKQVDGKHWWMELFVATKLQKHNI